MKWPKSNSTGCCQRPMLRVTTQGARHVPVYAEQGNVQVHVQSGTKQRADPRQAGALTVSVAQ
eukprot:4412553-Lingulodinium_polyedra.AAC.1